MRHDLTLEMGGAGGEFSPRGAARRRTSAHSGGGAAGESHQLVAAVRANSEATTSSISSRRREDPMLREPVSNDRNRPLISILIHDYYGRDLRQCLESIFTQDALDNIEIIFFDSASSDDG